MAAAAKFVLAGVVWDQEGAKIPEDAAQFPKGAKVTKTINQLAPHLLRSYPLDRAPFQVEILVSRAEEILDSSRMHRNYQITVIQGERSLDATEDRKTLAVAEALFKHADKFPKELEAEKKVKLLPERLKGKDAVVYLFFDTNVFCKDSAEKSLQSMRQSVIERDRQQKIEARTCALAQTPRSLIQTVIAGQPIGEDSEEAQPPKSVAAPALLSQIGKRSTIAV